MHLNAKPPVFVPACHRIEIEKLSKAALMDMVWDYALQIAGVDGGHPQAIEAAIAEFRSRREIILAHRNQQNSGDSVA